MCSRACRGSVLAVVLLSVATTVAGGTAAIAEPREPASRREVERARKAYEEGAAAYKLGSFGEAAARFEEAYRIMQFPTMLFDIAQSYRRLGEEKGRVQDLRKALELYRAFLRDAAPGADRRPIADKLIPGLEKQIAAQSRRLREELMTRAAGQEGLFLADQLVAEGATADALSVLDRVLLGPRNPRAVILGALVRRGVCASRLGRRDVAIESFRRALSLDPGVPLGSDDAAATAAWSAARQGLGERQRALALVHVPPGAVARGQDGRVRVSVEADAAALVSELMLHYRPAGQGAYSSVRAPREARELAIPAAFLVNLRGGAAVEYYVTALDAREGVLVTAGSATEPFVLQIAAPAAEREARADVAPAWYQRWWVWGLAAGVVAGAAGGAYLLSRDGPSNPPALLIPTR